MGRTHIASPEQSTELLPGIHFLCRFFWGPDLRHCLEMAQGGFLKAFSALQPMLSLPARTAAGAFNTYLDARLDPALLCRELELAYARLFLSGRGTGGAPPYQSCYLFENAPLMGPSALRMQERLGSAGLSLALQGNEPPDHLAVELEYLYFLLARARAEESPESALQAAEFAKTELCDWLPRFSDRLMQIPDAEPYSHAAVLTLDLVCIIAGKQQA